MGSNKISPAGIWGSDEPWVIVHPTSEDKITRFLDSQNIKPCDRTLYEEALEEIKQGKKSGLDMVYFSTTKRFREKL